MYQEAISRGPLSTNCHTKRKPISRPIFSAPYPWRRYPNEPPDPGNAAPSSLHTMPSHSTMMSATSQPSIACGPPSADMSSGIVMNGPIPIMFVMFSAVACIKPKRRSIGLPSGVETDTQRHRNRPIKILKRLGQCDGDDARAGQRHGDERGADDHRIGTVIVGFQPQEAGANARAEGLGVDDRALGLRQDGGLVAVIGPRQGEGGARRVERR